MLRFDLPPVRANVIRWEALITFAICCFSFFVFPWTMLILVVQGGVRGFLGHSKCPSHLLWKKIFEARQWAGKNENAGPKMFAAKLLFLASTVCVILLALGNPLWKVPCGILIVFSFMEWAFSICAACWVYGLWYKKFPPRSNVENHLRPHYLNGFRQ